MIRKFALWLFNKYYSIDISINMTDFRDVSILPLRAKTKGWTGPRSFFMSTSNCLELFLREK